MESDATWLTDHQGAGALEAAYCCINARLRDYGRFGLLFLNQGKAGAKQVVPAWWVEQATTPQSSQVQWAISFPIILTIPAGFGRVRIPCAGFHKPPLIIKVCFFSSSL